MVKVFGFDSVMEMVETVRDEIREEDKKYTQMICPYEYSNVGRQNNKDKIIYPDWVNETFDRVVKQTGPVFTNMAATELGAYTLLILCLQSILFMLQMITELHLMMFWKF